MNDTNELQTIRLQKVAQLQSLGVNPWPAQTPTYSTIASIRKNFEQANLAQEQTYIAAKIAFQEKKSTFEPQLPQRQLVAVVGRIRQLRQAGKKLYFIDIADQTNRIQLFLNHALLNDYWACIEQFDLGDWIWTSGKIGLTKTGEYTIFVEELKLLSKAILPPPNIAEKAGGQSISDLETKQRQRYLDLMMNLDSRSKFETRSRIIANIRNYLNNQGFLEVETPMMQPLFGGAAARPFITHHNTLDLDLYLRIAPELYLKRLLVGGFEKIYELNRNFRNEGIDTKHNPEFTMLELYEAFTDYNRMIELVENIYESALEAANLPQEIEYQGQLLSFERPWPKYTWLDLFNQYVRVDWEDRAALVQKAHSLQLPEKVFTLPTAFLAAELWEKTVEEYLVQPCFVIDFPTAISPLAKQQEQDPRFVERFECYAVGMELANAFSELNNPIEQRRRFEEQLQLAITTKNVELPREIDEDYLTALSYGMPPAGGLGIGIDRLVMLLTNTPSIRDVILFPQLRKG